MTHGVLLATALLAAPATSQGADNPSEGSVLRLRVATGAGEVEGTCVLVHREDRGTDAVLYFLTSAHLLRGPEDESPSGTHAVRVRLDNAQTLDVRRDDQFVPAGAFVDVALFRVTTAATALVPRPLIYEAPSADEVFLISGYDQSGAPATVAERLRFQSTFRAVGDRDASALVGCVGAPAVSRHGVFGIVSECDAGRSPVIALLSMARSFIDRHVPPKLAYPPRTLEFQLTGREIRGPLLSVACEATKTGEVDVPIDLGRRELAIDASASFTNPRAIRLAEVTVVKLEDRLVRLRFTLGGLPRTPAAPTACPQGQALVSVHLNLAVTRTP